MIFGWLKGNQIPTQKYVHTQISLTNSLLILYQLFRITTMEFFDNSTPPSPSIETAPIEATPVEILDHILSHCAMDAGIARRTCSIWNDIFEWRGIASQSINVSGLFRSVSLLQWAIDNGLPIDTVVRKCITIGDLAKIKMLARAVPEWKQEWTTHACIESRTTILAWLDSQGFMQDKELCMHAALHAGRLDICKWLKDHGANWPQSFSSFCARNGQLAILQWALNNGCPDEGNLMTQATVGDHVDIIVWLINIGYEGAKDKFNFQREERFCRYENLK